MSYCKLEGNTLMYGIEFVHVTILDRNFLFIYYEDFCIERCEWPLSNYDSIDR